MKRALIALLAFCFIFLLGCEKYEPSAEINRLMKKNVLSMELKVKEDDCTIKEATGEDGEYIEIEVRGEFSLRGEADIQPGKPYKLSITMKNENADPVVGYSFWTDSITTTRHYTLAGENGNPPVSATQERHSEWITFAETFEAREDEGAFLLTLHCTKGVFLIQDISIEEI